MTTPDVRSAERPCALAVRRSFRRTWRSLGSVGALLALPIGLAVAFDLSLAAAPDALPLVAFDLQPVPKFSLPELPGRLPGSGAHGLSTQDLIGHVTVLNVFSSWCTACRKEHPVLMRLAALGAVTLNGLNYRDKPNNAKAWLEATGDPYGAVGADITGKVAIAFGVYGVPETLIIDKTGHIAYKQIGPIDAAALHQSILPLLQRLKEE